MYSIVYVHYDVHFPFSENFGHVASIYLFLKYHFLSIETMRDLVRSLDPFLGLYINSYANYLRMTFFRSTIPHPTEDLLYCIVIGQSKLLAGPNIKRF